MELVDFVNNPSESFAIWSLQLVLLDFAVLLGKVANSYISTLFFVCFF